MAALVHRRARAILIAALGFFVVAAALGGPVAGQLARTARDFQDPGSESVAARERIEAATGSEPGYGVVALVRPGGDVRRDRAAAAAARDVNATLRRDPDVQGTLSWPATRDARLVSSDGSATAILVKLDPDADEEEAADRLRAELRGADVRLGGDDVVGPAIGSQVSEDLARAEMIAFPILFALSLWVFRGLVAALMPPLMGALAIVTAFLGMRLIDGWITELSIFALNLVTAMGLGLAIDYSLFVVSRYREELARVGPGREAIARTLATAGRTVLFSALTIAAAMASLLVFPLGFLRSMGIGGILVSLAGIVVALVVLPAVLAVLGTRINALAPRRWRRVAEQTARPSEEGGWYRLAHAVMRRPGPVAAVTAAALLVAGLPFLRIEFVPADARMLPASSEPRQVAEALERDFPRLGESPIRVVAQAPPSRDAALRAYRARVAAVDGTAVVTAPERLSADVVVFEARPPGDPLSQRNLDVLRAVREVDAPVPVDVGGEAAIFVDQQGGLAGSLALGLTLLVVTTFTILFLMTGSVVLPLKALLMNLLTLSATFGVLVLVFQDGRLEGVLGYESAGGLEATQPVLLFAIAFGLATDYAVFLLSRIKEARDGGLPDREAVAFGVERTGRIVTAAAMLFIVAVGAFTTSGVLFIKQVGLGTALAVAIDATLIRALLVPALMALLGRWNWWAPAPLRRLHDRIGIGEGPGPPQGAPA
jgi:RND superfamily putative drug exporter